MSLSVDLNLLDHRDDYVGKKVDRILIYADDFDKWIQKDVDMILALCREHETTEIEFRPGFGHSLKLPSCPTLSASKPLLLNSINVAVTDHLVTSQVLDMFIASCPTLVTICFSVIDSRRFYNETYTEYAKWRANVFTFLSIWQESTGVNILVTNRPNM
jgi:hypothetical protein